MERKQLTYADLAASASISQSFAHKLRTGGQTWLAPEMLAQIVAALTQDSNEQLLLVRGYLFDQLPPEIQEKSTFRLDLRDP